MIEFILLLTAVFLWGLYAAGKRGDCRSDRVSSRELAGLWRQTTADALVGYLYFSEAGAVYYMASRLPVTEAMFTDKYKLADSCADRTFSSWEYTAHREADGILLLEISGKAISGTYRKMG